MSANTVKIAIKYSGICHSDIHQARNEWFEGIFPMVPGHEIAGEVIEVGSDVNGFKVGDRVGVGTFVDSCRECEYCLAGRENVCLKGNVQTYNGRHYDGEPTYGGYARELVVDAKYLLKAPESLGLDVVAPLLCAGITVYSPLKRAAVGPGMRVAVLGLGGLGHLAVKFSVAFGAEVFVIGHSPAKRDEALAFGAKDYSLSEPADKFPSNFFDLILNTTSADLNLDALLASLRVGGELSNVGLPGNKQCYDPFSIVGGLKKITGSNTGSIAETQEMLNFCGSHGIGADIETIDASDPANVDAAYDRVVASQARYRIVIDATTI
jgi:uncharacterized zinc-type alcohol dehydrogenase-like protein